VHEQPGSLFKSITIIPGTDFIRLEEVFVVHALTDAERTEAEQRSLPRAAK
jgi:hypothetical protein